MKRRLIAEVLLALALGGACAWLAFLWAEPDAPVLEDTEEAFLA